MDSKPSSEKRFALLIDADNVSSKYIKPITDELSKYGTVTIKRIYGDWTLTLHSKWKDSLLENSLTPIQQFGYTQGKNATDSAMIIDAMDILYGGQVDGFCIVSSDSDFTRLAARIRESGLTVIGMGEKKTPVPFRRACDIFTTLELLVGDSGGSRGGRGGRGRGGQGGGNGATSSGPTFEQVEQAVVNIITDNTNNGKSTGLGEVGSRLLKRYPDFDVRSYGTNLLSKLLDKFESVKTIKDGSSVAVVLTEAGEAAAGAPATDADTSATVTEVAEVETAAAEAPAPEAAPGRARRSLRRRHERTIERHEATETNVVYEPVPEESTPEAKATPTKPKKAPAKKASPKKNAPKAAKAPDAFVRQQVRSAAAAGAPLSELGKQVRAKFRDFKVRDLGFGSFRAYVASLGDIRVEKDGKDFRAFLGE